MLTAIRHNLGRLTDFKGRDTRGRFWPWAGCVVGGSFLIRCGAIYAAFATSGYRLSAYMDSHPELTTVTRTGIVTQRTLEGSHPELFSDFRVLIWAMAGIAVVVIGLLAASVARRLHDCGRSARWGLAPLPFIALGLAFMDALMSQILAGPSIVVAVWVLIIALNHLGYLAVLLILIIQLSRAGSREANRFGPPVG